LRRLSKSNGKNGSRRAQVRWSFRSADDVKEFWKKFQRVPARKRRTKRDEERYCLGLYLLALATYRKLKYPLRIEEGESPDFAITWSSGKTTGLEVTKATNMWLQREMTKAEVEYEKREAAARLCRTNAEGVMIGLSNLGWAGDQAEAEWLTFVREAVERKLPKLETFRPTSRQDLLVYDDTPLPAINRAKVLPDFCIWLSDTRRSNSLLGHVSIIISLDVLLDSGREFVVLPFVDWSDPSVTPDFGERVEFAGEKAVRTRTVLAQDRES
jgi:hypothetical protein